MSAATGLLIDMPLVPAGERSSTADAFTASSAAPPHSSSAGTKPPEVLPGSRPLVLTKPLDEVMVDGINRFAERELRKSVERRRGMWNRDYRNPKAYAVSISENRQRLKNYIGAVDFRVKDPQFEIVSTLQFNGLLGASKKVRAYFVRWRVLRGITAEGILLQPQGPLTARLIALPDADWTPEQFCGFDRSDSAVPSRLVLQLAENGCQIIIPTLINRDDTFSGHPDVAYTNQPHREFIYRMAFEMGRHIIGYEVQKVLAAVDAFRRLNRVEKRKVPIGVVGVGEGGLLAFYSAAIDPRIEAALVCGYFQPREAVWQEPIYRNVWALLTEFGDADIASLIAPRTLVIEACAVPEISGPPKPKPGRRGGAAPGKIEIATLGLVREEYDRAKGHYDKLHVPGRITLVASREGDGPAGTPEALQAFAGGLGFKLRLPVTLSWNGTAHPEKEGELFDPVKRQERQFRELMRDVQNLLRDSARVRDHFWSKADSSSVKSWVKSTAYYRNHVWDEMIGRLPSPTLPLNVHSRKVIDEPTHTGYEVTLDVYPDVIAGGILLLPKDLKPGEKRPVVVCQHGLEGTPMDTITTDRTQRAWRYYKGFSTQLVQRGFIVYAPQNPYRGKDRFRVIQRKSNPLKRSLFSYILAQHNRTLDWLSALPFVDAQRIGFYGLSYGGKTAVRVPPLLKRYALSICSADFDEWVLKNVSNRDRYSYVFTGEYEMFEWNMGHTANYAELASLMAPRPFMVERGHNDGVAPDEWVAWEYAKVRRLYDRLGIGERTQIEFFNGPHTIHGKGTFEFLHRHLKWPKPHRP